MAESYKEWIKKSGKEKETKYETKIRKMLLEHNIPTMTVEELENCDSIFYTTFGFHDSEPPHSIISRKLEEFERNGFLLWGIHASNDRVETAKTFCKEKMAKTSQRDTILLLKFTMSLKQLKCKKDCDKENCNNKCTAVWKFGEDKQLDDSGLFNYCKIDGKEIDLKSKQIYVKGSDIQNKAFVVKEVFLFEDKVSYSGIEAYYTTYSDQGLCTKTPLFMLMRNNNEHLDFNSAGGEHTLTLAFKLKTPDCIEACYNDSQQEV